MSNPQPRIAIFLLYLGGGGAERAMLNLAAGFVQQSYAVDLVLANAWGPHLKKIPPGVELVDLQCPNTPRTVPALIKYLRREQPILLISAMHYSNEVALCAKRFVGKQTTLIVNEQNNLTQTLPFKTKRRQWLIPKFVRYLYPWADHIVGVSQGVSEDLAHIGGWQHSFPAKHTANKTLPVRVKTIYNPVITPELLQKAQEPCPHPWFQPGQPPVLLGVGKLEPQKDFPNLLRAFHQVRLHNNCRLAILGWGPDRPQLEALIQELNLESDVALLGYIDNPYPYMAQATLFVLSSAWEGLPTVLIEAMALGTPVVSTNCPSGPEEILDQGKYGILVPVGDSSALAIGILQTLSESIQPTPEQWLDQFTTQASVQKYLNLIPNS